MSARFVGSSDDLHAATLYATTMILDNDVPDFSMLIAAAAKKCRKESSSFLDLLLVDSLMPVNSPMPANPLVLVPAHFDECVQDADDHALAEKKALESINKATQDIEWGECKVCKLVKFDLFIQVFGLCQVCFSNSMATDDQCSSVCPGQKEQCNVDKCECEWAQCNVCHGWKKLDPFLEVLDSCPVCVLQALNDVEETAVSPCRRPVVQRCSNHDYADITCPKQCDMDQWTQCNKRKRLDLHAAYNTFDDWCCKGCFAQFRIKQASFFSKLEEEAHQGWSDSEWSAE